MQLPSAQTWKRVRPSVLIVLVPVSTIAGAVAGGREMGAVAGGREMGAVAGGASDAMGSGTGFIRRSTADSPKADDSGGSDGGDGSWFDETSA